MKKPKDFFVYLHKKPHSGEVFYVGKGKGYRATDRCSRSKHWHSVVNKHGLQVEIVLDGLQEWYAFELETQLIAYYGREKLCNHTDGGEGPSGMIVSQKTIDDRRLKTTGLKRDNQTKIRMSKAQKAVKSSTVFCSNGLNFSSLEDAVSWLHKNGHPKASKGPICVAAKSQDTRSAYGLCWSYKKHPEKSAKEAKHRWRGKIKCSNGMIFESQKHAKEWLIEFYKDHPEYKKSFGKISNACTGQYPSAYGFQWFKIEI